MSAPAVTVVVGTPIAAAAALLAERGFTGLPVTDDDDHLVGIVTEADLIRDRIAADPRIYGRTVRPTHRGRPETVGDVMTTSVESLTPGADVADAARMMLAENIRCFPIVDGNAVVGVVTRRDVLRAGVIHSDRQLGETVAGELSALDDSGRFAVTVQAGVADIQDYGTGVGGRAAAARAAAAVPGIVAVAVTHQPCDPF
jgi:CBS domain-containing protein